MPEKSKTGHRQRLRERFLSGEKDSRSDEALLEILLTYAIPQQDVRPLAQKLLAELGALSAVLDASVERLCQFDGIRSNTATLLKIADWIRLNHTPQKAPYTYDLLHIEIYPHNDYLSTKAFLLALKAKGYRPQVIVTDMLAAYEVAIPEVFEKAIHQFCIFHALQGAQRKIKEIWGKNYEKIPEVVALKTKIYRTFRATTQRTVRKRFEEVMALREVYVASQPDAAELFDNLEHQFPHLIHAIGNPSIPRTNNTVELTNRRFDQLYSTMCGFDSIESARHYLRGFELAYRFTPLSQEVKDPAMRGECPLDIAGYQVRHLPLWGYLNTPLSMRVESCAVNFSP